MKKIILTIFILNFSFVFSQGQKIGYVNTQSIFAQNEDARLAHADVEKEAKRLQAEYENKAIALITGESVGQVASQTLSNMRAINDVCDLPIIRPLSGLNKEEIIVAE